MRTIAIGDVHGCYSALSGLIDAIQPQKEDRLIFLGDYVDRGPDSRRVLDRLIELKDECSPVFLRGNHDYVMQQWADGFIDQAMWETIGGGTTLESYGFAKPEEIPLTHLQFLDQCENFFETDTHIFVHGNYRANVLISDTDVETLLWCHLSWPLPKPHISGKTVVVGHTPQTSGHVADFGHLVCVDTFCFGGGRLTAYDVDRRSALQADANGRIVHDWNDVRAKGWLGRMAMKIFSPRSNSECDESQPTNLSGQTI